MIDAPLALAFTAGLVATVNPCGFAMLPAYLAWFVGVDDTDSMPSPAARAGRALGVSAVVSLTFIVVFGLVGVLVTAGALVVIDAVPWLAIVIGVGLTVAGVAMLRGWTPSVSLPQRSRGVRSRGMSGVLLFGASYAVASLSCTLPIFLAVVAGTITSADLASGVATFIAYGTGMSLVLVAVTIAVALAHKTFVQRMRRATRHVHRAAALLLILAGVYIALYWAFTLASPAGSRNGQGPPLVDGPAGLVERMSTWTVNRLEQLALPASVVLAGFVFAALWTALGRRTSSPDEDGLEGHPPTPTKNP